MTDPLGDWSYTPILIEWFFSAEVSIKNEKKRHYLMNHQNSVIIHR